MDSSWSQAPSCALWLLNPTPGAVVRACVCSSGVESAPAACVTECSATAPIATGTLNGAGRVVWAAAS